MRRRKGEGTRIEADTTDGKRRGRKLHHQIRKKKLSRRDKIETRREFKGAKEAETKCGRKEAKMRGMEEGGGRMRTRPENLPHRTRKGGKMVGVWMGKRLFRIFLSYVLIFFYSLRSLSPPRQRKDDERKERKEDKREDRSLSPKKERKEKAAKAAKDKETEKPDKG